MLSSRLFRQINILEETDIFTYFKRPKNVVPNLNDILTSVEHKRV